MEVKRRNESFGIFESSDVKSMISYLQKNTFCVVLFGNGICPIKRHVSVQSMQCTALCSYTGILITTQGKEAFEKRFHASKEYRSEEMIDTKTLKDLLSYDANFLPILDNLSSATGFLLKKVSLRTRTLAPFGVFSLKTLKDSRSFIDENGFFLLDVDHKKDILQKTENQRGFPIVGFVITMTKSGVKSFKDSFYRSSDYVDAKMISFLDFKCLFEKYDQTLKFLEELEKDYGAIQVKVIKEIRIREKVLINA